MNGKVQPEVHLFVLFEKKYFPEKYLHEPTKCIYACFTLPN
jgi:hypothetical protein